MEKKELEITLGNVDNARSSYVRASNEACNALTAFMMDRSPVSANLVDEDYESLEENSEYVNFNSEKSGRGPEVGVIRSVYWDTDVVRVSGLVDYPMNEDGSHRTFDCTLEEISNVENVLKFVLRYAE